MDGDPNRKRVRASDTERAQVAAWLTVAFEEGRLDLAEFDRRSGASTLAVCRADLVALTDDLPPVPEAELERRMKSPAGDGRPAYRGPIDRSKAVAFVLGSLLGGFSVEATGSILPLILLLAAVAVVGGLGWAFWDSYGHHGRRD
jgi:hypothetical protein